MPSRKEYDVYDESAYAFLNDNYSELKVGDRINVYMSGDYERYVVTKRVEDGKKTVVPVNMMNSVKRTRRDTSYGSRRGGKRSKSQRRRK